MTKLELNALSGRIRGVPKIEGDTIEYSILGVIKAMVFEPVQRAETSRLRDAVGDEVYHRLYDEI